MVNFCSKETHFTYESISADVLSMKNGWDGDRQILSNVLNMPFPNREELNLLSGEKLSSGWRTLLRQVHGDRTKRKPALPINIEEMEWWLAKRPANFQKAKGTGKWTDENCATGIQFFVFQSVQDGANVTYRLGKFLRSEK